MEHGRAEDDEAEEVRDDGHDEGDLAPELVQDNSGNHGGSECTQRWSAGCNGTLGWSIS